MHFFNKFVKIKHVNFFAILYRINAQPYFFTVTHVKGIIIV